MTCSIRNPRDVVSGDTVTDAAAPTTKALPGFRPVKPNVFAGLYPTNPGGIVELRAALERLVLNDAAFTFEPEQSDALGPGFRCGFLGLLHLDIVQERLEREHDVSLVTTSPSVAHRIVLQNGERREISHPGEMPDVQLYRAIEEPMVVMFLLVPASSLGALMALATERRGSYKSTEYLSPERVKLTFEIPLAELVVDFYDKLKSATSGYGSMDYEWKGFVEADLVKLDVLVNEKVCEPLSSIVPRDQAYARGRALVERLKGLIPRQLYQVILQAAIGANIIARDTIRPVGKNVTGKCYGGDITRKRKLWEKQKQGKKRMKQFGKVEIPQEAFLSILKRD
jgi:GTP-binding protein LepA